MINPAKVAPLVGALLLGEVVEAAPSGCKQVGTRSLECTAPDDFRLAHYCLGRGRPTAVLLSATWCRPCHDLWRELRPDLDHLDWVKLDVTQAVLAERPSADLIELQTMLGDGTPALPILRLFSEDCHSFETSMGYKPIVALVEGTTAPAEVVAAQAEVVAAPPVPWRHRTNEIVYGVGGAMAFGLGVWFHLQAEDAADRGRSLKSDDYARQRSLNNEIAANNLGTSLSVAAGIALLGWLVFDLWTSQ